MADQWFGAFAKTDGFAKSKQFKVAFIGYACEDGVLRCNGRAGCSAGPGAVRRKLEKIGPMKNPEFQCDLSNVEFVDKGNVALAAALEDTHQNLLGFVSDLLDKCFIPIIVGGGKDQSYPNAKALIKSIGLGNINIVSIGARLAAVQPANNKCNAESPFYFLLGDSMFSGSGTFHQFAAQGSKTNMHTAEFVRGQGGRITWLTEVKSSGSANSFRRLLSELNSLPTFVSISLDSVRSSDAPGVISPSSEGLTSSQVLDICFEAGKYVHTCVLDISDICPQLEEERTASLVASMIYHFVLGLSCRNFKI